jgi:hypothetical protein
MGRLAASVADRRWHGNFLAVRMALRLSALCLEMTLHAERSYHHRCQQGPHKGSEKKAHITGTKML